MHKFTPPPLLTLREGGSEFRLRYSEFRVPTFFAFRIPSSDKRVQIRLPNSDKLHSDITNEFFRGPSVGAINANFPHCRKFLTAITLVPPAAEHWNVLTIQVYPLEIGFITDAAVRGGTPAKFILIPIFRIPTFFAFRIPSSDKGFLVPNSEFRQKGRFPNSEFRQNQCHSETPLGDYTCAP